MSGWIKLHRSVMRKGYYGKSEYLAVWVHLLLKANHSKTEVLLDGRMTSIDAGSFVTSRSKLAQELNLQESKLERILKCFKTGQQIEQQSFSKYRIISITNWSEYQESEQQNEQQMNSKRTANEQQMNTDKNVKNVKNEKKNNRGIFHPPTFEEVKAYCLERNRGVDPVKWFDFYQAKGWMVGKNKMMDWQAAVRTWEKTTDNSIENKKPVLDSEESAKIRKVMAQYGS